MQGWRVIQSKLLAVFLTVLSLGVGLEGCRSQSSTPESSPDDIEAEQEIDNRLTFNDFTLEQADEEGKPQWRIHAEEAVYDQDKKVAEVTRPNGELFEDGEPVYKIQARRGEVQQDGEKITLRGNIIATDIKSGAVLRGDQLQWTPKDGILIVRNNLTVTHPDLTATATEARLNNRRRRVDLTGKVVAVTKEPVFRLQAERLTWRIDEQIVTSSRPIRVERLNGNQVIDTAVGQEAEVNIKTRVATLKQNAQLNLQDPPVQVNSNVLVWDLVKKTVNSPVPVTVVHRQQQIILTANQGLLYMERRVFTFSQNVRAVSQSSQAELTSNTLSWNIPTEEITAEGNVDYRQADPFLTVQGSRAFGKLRNKTIVVSGGTRSEFVPEQVY